MKTKINIFDCPSLTITMNIDSNLLQEIIKEAKEMNLKPSEYIELLLKTHQDRVSKFVSILRNPK